MSGGHFNDCSYVYYEIEDFAQELAEEIENNNGARDASDYPGFNSEVIDCLKAQLPLLRKTAIIMRAIDYLYSGDYGEETFLEKMKELTK